MSRFATASVVLAVALAAACVTAAAASKAGSPSTSQPFPAGNDDVGDGSGEFPHFQKFTPSFREMFEFNFLGDDNPVGPLLRSLCTGPGTKGFYEPYGCPNLGAFGMSAVKVGKEEQVADLVTTVMATTGLPTAVMSFYTLASDFNLTARSCQDIKCAEVIAGDLLHHNYSSVVDLDANAFVSVLSFQSIIEFEDNDGDGEYNPSSDVFVSSYDFLVPSDAHRPLWGPMNFTRTQLGSGAELMSLNVSTQDGVFSFKLDESNSLADASLASAKISIQIKNYPYQSKERTSKLALLTYLATAHDGATLKSSTKETKVSVQSNGMSGFFSWDPTAQVSGLPGSASDVKVTHTPWTYTEPFMDEWLLTSIASAALTVGGGNAAAAVAKYSFFAFDSRSPDLIYWDPELAFGEPEQTPADLTFLIIAVSTVGGVCIVILGVAIGVWRRRVVKQSELKPLLAPRASFAESDADDMAGEELGSKHMIGASDDEAADAASVSIAPRPSARSDVGSAAAMASAGAVAGAARAADQSATCAVCSYHGPRGEGFCGNCGTRFH